MEDAGILVDYAICGTLPKVFNKPGSYPKNQSAEEQNILRVRSGITIVNKEKKSSVENTVGLLKEDLPYKSKKIKKKEIVTNEVNENNIEERKNQHFLNLIKCMQN